MAGMLRPTIGRDDNGAMNRRECFAPAVGRDDNGAMDPGANASPLRLADGNGRRCQLSGGTGSRASLIETGALTLVLHHPVLRVGHRHHVAEAAQRFLALGSLGDLCAKLLLPVRLGGQVLVADPHFFWSWQRAQVSGFSNAWAPCCITKPSGCGISVPWQGVQNCGGLWQVWQRLVSPFAFLPCCWNQPSA